MSGKDRERLYHYAQGVTSAPRTPSPQPVPIGRLVAYEVVNKADPATVNRIDLPNGDPSGRVLDGLLRQMNVYDWFVRDVYA